MAWQSHAATAAVSATAAAPRERLAAIVKFGMVPPNAPPGYVSDMPAFAGKLTGAQIDNVLAWIESQCPQETLKRRAEMLKQR